MPKRRCECLMKVATKRQEPDGSETLVSVVKRDSRAWDVLTGLCAMCGGNYRIEPTINEVKVAIAPRIIDPTELHDPKEGK